MKTQITSLVDKYSINNLLTENGLSFYIGFKGKKILYDAGLKNAFLKNANSLKIKLEDVGLLILSHGHFDHTGGLGEFIKLNSKAKIYLHRDAVSEYYLKLLFFYKYIGINKSMIDQINGKTRGRFVCHILINGEERMNRCLSLINHKMFVARKSAGAIHPIFFRQLIFLILN